MKRNWTLLVPIALLGGCAQQAPQRSIGTPASVPVPAPMAARAPTPPVVNTLPGAICEPARTGETILRVQTAVDRLMPRVQADPAYGGAWYEHAPCYRIVFAFKDGQPRQWVIDAAEPELRPYIAFGRTRYSDIERERTSREIMAAVAAAGVPFIFYSSVKPEQFTLTVRSEPEMGIARRAIPPRYGSDVIVLVGNIYPQPERR